MAVPASGWTDRRTDGIAVASTAIAMRALMWRAVKTYLLLAQNPYSKFCQLHPLPTKNHMAVTVFTNTIGVRHDALEKLQ